jgi:hypothetical protein
MTREMMERMLGKPKENEQFAVCGGLVVFDVWKAYQLLLANPREPIYISTDQTWLENVMIVDAKLERADITKAGILASLTPDYMCMIDGNHRLAKRLALGYETMGVFELSLEESKLVQLGGPVTVIDGG